MATLLIPQEPLAIATFKDLFRKLAHSSIMKLDAASMDKLLYLILMTVKKELFLTSSPLELFPLTLGNLQTLQHYARGTDSEQLLEANIGLFRAAATSYSFLQYQELKEYLLTLLENYQTKVINFHESGHQNQQGKLTFVRRNHHNELPLGNARDHPPLKLAAPPSSKTALLPIKGWKQWKTSLVMDHVSEYEKQSERRKMASEMGWSGKEKDLNELFALNQEAVEDFEVQLDLFDYGTVSAGSKKEGVRPGVVVSEVGSSKSKGG
jgi:hypothetical protein